MTVFLLYGTLFFKHMNVSDVMSTSLITVGLTTTFTDLWKSIFTNKVNAVLVVDKQKKLSGIVTREDLLSRLYPDYSELFASDNDIPDFEGMERKVSELSGLKARDVMCKRVIYTSRETPVMRALSRMIVRRVDQLPVLSDTGVIVGMITKGDIFYSVFKNHVRKPAKKVTR